MFLRNYWYVAAYDHEIGRRPLGRIILGEPIVFYRLEDGTPVALEDRCAHRRLPLSMGKIVGDALQCHYHGLRFDRAGQCVRVPGQDLIPPQARVKSYPLVARYRWLWIWMGDPARADPDLITDFHWFADKDWGAKHSYLHVEANWQLVVDNLLDLTHLAFVHETTIGNAALVENAAVKVQRTADNVTVTRWMTDTPAPPTFVKVGSISTAIRCRLRRSIPRWCSRSLNRFGRRSQRLRPEYAAALKGCSIGQRCAAIAAAKMWQDGKDISITCFRRARGCVWSSIMPRCRTANFPASWLSCAIAKISRLVRSNLRS